MDGATNVGGRILVPLDGSALADQALPYARALAMPGAEVRLLWVVPEPEAMRGGLAGQVIFSKEDILRADEEAARRLLDAAAERLRAGSEALGVEVAIGGGNPADEILRIGAEWPADLVVLATHGRGALGRWAFGSVADRVSRGAVTPVMLVRPRRGGMSGNASVDLRRVIVPLDGSERAACALPIAAGLANRSALPVLLLSVVDPTRQLSALSTGGVGYDAAFYEAVRSDLQTAAERTLAAAGARLRGAGLSVVEEALEGAPAPTILDRAGPSDLVVLTSHGRSGVRRWLLVSVAEKLVREGTSPVILVPSAAPSEDAGLPLSAGSKG